MDRSLAPPRGLARRVFAALALALCLLAAAPARAQGVAEADAIAFAELFVDAAAETAPDFAGSDRFFLGAGLSPEPDGVLVGRGGFVLATAHPEGAGGPVVVTMLLDFENADAVFAALAERIAARFGIDATSAAEAVAQGVVEIGLEDGGLIAIVVFAGEIEPGVQILGLTASSF